MAVTTFVAEPLPLMAVGTPGVPDNTAWRVDHTITSLPIYRSVKMATGEERRRRVHRSTPSTVSLTRELSAADAELWRAWWEDDVESGGQGFKAVVSNMGTGTAVANLIARGQPKYKPADDGFRWVISIDATIVSYGSTIVVPPVVLPPPFWADTFTAPNGTNPVGRAPETFPNYPGMTTWGTTFYSDGIEIRNGEVAQGTNPLTRWLEDSIILAPTLNNQAFAASVSVTFFLKITFDAVRLRLNAQSDYYLQTHLNFGSNLQPRLRFYDNGAYEVLTPDQIYSGPQVGGGTFTYVFHVKFTGPNSAIQTFYANGVLVGQGPGVQDIAYMPNIEFQGLFDTVRPTEVRCYTDLSDAQMLTLVGTPVTPTPIPAFPTPPATLTAIVRDTFTAANGTLPTARLPDVYPTGLAEGSNWIATGTSPGEIQSNRLILTDENSFVTNSIEDITNKFLYGEILPTFPMTLYLQGSVGTRSSATGATPEIYVSWGYVGFYFDIVLREGNRYMGSAAGYAWQSTGYLSASAPTAGAGTHKLAMFYDGTRAYLILNGAVVETSPDISATVVDPKNGVGFSVEMGSNALAGYTNTFAEEVAMYYGGTLAQAVALTV